VNLNKSRVLIMRDVLEAGLSYTVVEVNDGLVSESTARAADSLRNAKPCGSMQWIHEMNESHSGSIQKMLT
jgi:hypothetical protein